MKKLFMFLIVFIYTILCNSALADYTPAQNESVTNTFIVPENNDNPHFSISPDLSPKKYVRSYVTGGSTYIQICEVGGISSDHTYGADEEYVKNKIVDVKEPTCTENGSMTIKCQYPRCNKTATVVLLKTGHGAPNHYIGDEGICPYCQKVRHTEEYTGKKDSKKHYYTCSYPGCDAEKSGSHSYDDNNPVCRVCDYENSGHVASDTWMITEDEHIKMCANSECEVCDGEYIFIRGPHIGATHDNPVCKECNEPYQTHNIETTIQHDTDTHWYGCSFPGCGKTFSKEPHSTTEKPIGDSSGHYYICENEGCGEKYGHTDHVGGTHDNGGECTECGYKYKEHNKGEIDYDKDGHWYKCTGCSEKYTEPEAHNLVENAEKQKKCTGCNYIQTGHGPIGNWIQEENRHYKKCAIDGCVQEWDRGEHIGGTHGNNGACQECGYEYQEHSQGERDKNESGHWYKCTGCSENYSEIEAHNFKNKDGKRICETCGYEDTAHAAKEEWSGDGDYHYKECQVENCTEHKFNYGKHEGGTHGNDGICQICEQQYQSHMMDTERKGTHDEIYHRFGCSTSECTFVYKEEHKKNGKPQVAKDYHWYVCKVCETSFGEEEHKDLNGDDKCDVCGKDFVNLPEKITVKEYIELEKVGDTENLEVKWTPKEVILDLSQLEWSSSDENIVTVDANGVVTALKEGTAVVTVRLGNLNAKCAVSVGEEFEIIASKTEMYEEDYVTLYTNFDDKNDVDISWDIRSGDDELGDLEDGTRPDPEDPRKEIPCKVFHSSEDAAEDTVTIYATLNGKKAQVKIKIVHKGGTHENKGKCTVCGEEYQKHKLGDYKYKDETGHWQECSYKDCKGIKYNPEPHTGSSSCTKCKWKKQGGTGSGGTGNGGTGNGGTGSGGTGNGGTDWQDLGDGHCREEYIGTDEPVRYGGLVRKMKHTFVNGVCERCGAIQPTTCDHKHTSRRYVFKNENVHQITCAGDGSVPCNAPLGTEPHNFRIDDVCEDCNYKKGGGNGSPTMEYRECNLYIATKEYYLLESGPITIDITDLVCLGGIKEFTWNMDTVPNKEFSSKGEKESNDGTIIFKYEGDNNKNNKFIAKLNESNIQKMSAEAKITITLKGNSGQSSSQTIKLIKKGPPSSKCLVKFDDLVYTTEDNSIKIIVRTLYDDYTDQMINESGLPLYGIDEETPIEVKSKSEDVIEIIGEPTVTNLSDRAGFLITVPASFKKVGSATVEVSLKTIYQWNSNYKELKKEENRFERISVIKASEDISSEETGPSPITPPGSIEEDTGDGTGALAAVGAGGLLLLLAVIGASMNKRR